MSRLLTIDGDHRPLLDNLLLAERTAERMRGLLGRESLAPNTGLLIRPCRSIHMWFMRFPIDVAFLDADLRVLKIVSNLRPWQIALAPRGTQSVLETAAGQLCQLQIGNTLIIN